MMPLGHANIIALENHSLTACICGIVQREDSLQHNNHNKRLTTVILSSLSSFRTNKH